MISCTTKGTAPVVNRQTGPEPGVTDSRSKTGTPASKTASKVARSRDIRGYHVVIKGDTLYSIAWNYGHDFRDVAVWNGIQAPYLIYPGQVIRLKPPPATKTTAVQPGPIVSKQAPPGPVIERAPTPPASQKPVKAPRVSVNTASKPQGLSDRISWSWPVKGKIIKTGSLTSKKGVDIAGRLGQDIKAAARGNVVYSGSGLLGYGRLIIIKHNERFLSAYAHNRELLVKEGDSVSKGQVIARMGANSKGQAQLHFEIRENGKSVNPLSLLPKS